MCVENRWCLRMRVLTEIPQLPLTSDSREVEEGRREESTGSGRRKRRVKEKVKEQHQQAVTGEEG